ncbi:MAG: insulinase family protein, partial [Planctomycetes bacterium]|nr:insulinase family protein [Planctomycetota bacterium]
MGGLLEETDANNGLTTLMTTMATKGTRDHSGAEINEYFDGIGGSIGATAGNNTFVYTSEVMSQDFAEAFDLFAEVVLEPNFPDDELGKVKEMLSAAIAQVDNSWPDEARQFFREKFFVNGPYMRSSLGKQESIESLTREQLMAFHEQAVVGSRSVMTIFGDIDVAAVEDMVRQRFNDVTKGTVLDFGQFEAEPEIETPRRFTKETPKNGATIYVGYPGMKLTDIQDRYAMEVLTEIIG